MNELHAELLPHEEQKPNYMFEGMDERLLALQWQNFLKRIAGRILSEQEAKTLLITELEELRASKKRATGNVPLLDDDAAASIQELQQYLSGAIRPQESRFALKEFPELYLPSRGYELSRLPTECLKAKQEYLRSYEALYVLVYSTDFHVFEEKKYPELYNRFLGILHAMTSFDEKSYAVDSLESEYQKLREQCQTLIKDIKEGVSEKTKSA